MHLHQGQGVSLSYCIVGHCGYREDQCGSGENTLSSLINKVAHGKARVVLESRGKPKAALISTEDLESRAPGEAQSRSTAPVAEPDSDLVQSQW